jgi:hypothetical protein
MHRTIQYRLAEQARKEAELRLLRERLELHAKASKWHRAQLAILLREEAEKSEYDGLRRQRDIDETGSISEAEWNAVLHPRTGTPPNPGQCRNDRR